MRSVLSSSSCRDEEVDLERQPAAPPETRTRGSEEARPLQRQQAERQQPGGVVSPDNSPTLPVGLKTGRYWVSLSVGLCPQVWI